MPKIKYVDWKPKADTLTIIDLANAILEEFEADGWHLSLRQLYYQFVAKDLIPNTQKSYNRLGSIVSKARDAGLIDWSRIQDRGRSTYARPSWRDGESFLYSQAYRFHLDWWQDQPVRVQVWVEKEALADVVGRAASGMDVSYFPNKGYVSASSVWASAQEMLEHDCDHWVILHLGDHDPSGIDMTRDIHERLNLYTTPHRQGQTRPYVDVRRIALNMDQVEEYNPPPNPAKQTDSRFADYARTYGEESWELDALEPGVITSLIEREIKKSLALPDLYNEQQAKEKTIRRQLQNLELPKEDY